MLKAISSMGIKSDHMYTAGLASVGLYWLVHGRAASPGHRPS